MILPFNWYLCQGFAKIMDLNEWYFSKMALIIKISIIFAPHSKK